MKNAGNSSAWHISGAGFCVLEIGSDLGLQRVFQCLNKQDEAGTAGLMMVKVNSKLLKEKTIRQAL